MEATGAKLLPFYLVTDASYSMSGPPINEVNQIMQALVDALARNPILSDKVRFGLIDFAEDARVQLPLCDLLDPNLVLPKLSVRGGTSYAAAFHLLRTEIDANVAQLKADGFVVHRPAVYFLSDGAPTDTANKWRAAFDALVNGGIYPNIIPFGVAEADGKLLQQLIHPSSGNKAMKMFLSDQDDDAAKAITAMAEILITSVINSGHSMAQGQSGIVLPTANAVPAGVTAYGPDDDFV